MTSYETLKLSVWKTEDLTQRMEIRALTVDGIGAIKPNNDIFDPLQILADVSASVRPPGIRQLN